MISKDNNCEYSFMIADLMVTLSNLDEFVLRIRVGEFEFIFNEKYDLLFLQEGIRAEKDGRINYVLYDLMDLIQVISG